MDNQDRKRKRQEECLLVVDKSQTIKLKLCVHLMHNDRESFDGSVEERLLQLLDADIFKMMPRSTIHDACFLGASLKLIKRMNELDSRGSIRINLYSHTPSSTLEYALRGGCEEAVIRYLLEQAPEVIQKRNRWKSISLSLGQYDYANVEIVKVLLEAAPRALRALFKNGDTNVHRAIRRREIARHADDHPFWSRNSKVIKTLVDAWPVSLQIRNCAKQSPLHVLLASDDSDEDLVEFMITRHPEALSYFKFRFAITWVFADHPRLIPLAASLYSKPFLYIENVGFDEQQARALGVGLSTNRHVREISFRCSGFDTGTALDAFLSSLSNPRIEALDITGYGNITCSSSVLPRLLRENPGIKRLSLPIGLESNAVLSASGTLQDLCVTVEDMFNCNQGLCDAMRDNKTMERLEFRLLFLGPDHLKSIAGILVHNSHLKCLRIKCGLAAERARNEWDLLIQSMRDHNVSLTTIELEYGNSPDCSDPLVTFQSKLAYYARLNAAGRKRARESDAGAKRRFVTEVLPSIMAVPDADCQFLSQELPRQQMIYGLLRDVPYLWST